MHRIACGGCNANMEWLMALPATASRKCSAQFTGRARLAIWKTNRKAVANRLI
jgi:hypothetical protein